MLAQDAETSAASVSPVVADLSTDTAGVSNTELQDAGNETTTTTVILDNREETGDDNTPKKQQQSNGVIRAASLGDRILAEAGVNRQGELTTTSFRGTNVFDVHGHAYYNKEKHVVEPMCPCGTTATSGRMIVCCGPERGVVFPVHCVVGPDWCCMTITYSLLIVPSIAILVLLVLKKDYVMLTIGLFTTLGLLTCYSLTALSDPGTIQKQTLEQLEDQQARGDIPLNESEYIICPRCNIYRPFKTSHCYTCDVCVEGLDHHCPWTGKCIGKRNIRFFYAFLTCLAIQIVFVFVALSTNVVPLSVDESR